MRKSYRTITVNGHPKDKKAKQTALSLPRQDDCRTRKDIKYCIPKRRPTQSPHKQWEVHITINQQQQTPSGGTLIFSYIRRLGSFLGFKILNFNIFGGFQKNIYFLGYEDFVDIFGGVITNLDYV